MNIWIWNDLRFCSLTNYSLQQDIQAFVHDNKDAQKE